MRLLIAAVAALVLTAPADAAEIPVTTHADVVDNGGDCGLREAIMAANLNVAWGDCPAGSATTADRVQLEEGLYLLTRSGAGENANDTGDLDAAAGTLLITGRGPGTTISSAGIDRVLDVGATSIVRLDRLTVA